MGVIRLLPTSAPPSGSGALARPVYALAGAPGGGPPWPAGGFPPRCPPGPPGPPRPGGGLPTITLVAVTVPSLFVVPMTAMKSPTFSAEEVVVPERVRKVVLAAKTIVSVVLSRLVMVMSLPDSAVILPAAAGLAASAGGAPAGAPAGALVEEVAAAPAATDPRLRTAANTPPPTRARREGDQRQREPGDGVGMSGGACCGLLLSGRGRCMGRSPVLVMSRPSALQSTVRYRVGGGLRQCCGPRRNFGRAGEAD
jgi:hypothetical protein